MIRGPLHRLALLIAALSLLAGCATSPPAPVEDRAGEGFAEPRATGPQAETAGRPETPAPVDVRVEALPESPPARPKPLPPAAATGTQARRAAPAPPESPANPAVVALVDRAEREGAAGRHDTAAASLERAIAIEPGNAWLWHRLASARLAQGRAGEAVSLAARSTALAAGDTALQARNWRLIARVHRQRGEEVAAREAERRARELDTPPS